MLTGDITLLLYPLSPMPRLVCTPDTILHELAGRNMGEGAPVAAEPKAHPGNVDPFEIATPELEKTPIGIGRADTVIVFPVGLISILIPSPDTNVRLLPVDESEVTFFILTILLGFPKPEAFTGRILYQ